MLWNTSLNLSSWTWTVVTGRPLMKGQLLSFILSYTQYPVYQSKPCKHNTLKQLSVHDRMTGGMWYIKSTAAPGEQSAWVSTTKIPLSLWCLTLWTESTAPFTADFLLPGLNCIHQGNKLLSCTCNLGADVWTWGWTDFEHVTTSLAGTSFVLNGGLQKVQYLK